MCTVLTPPLSRPSIPIIEQAEADIFYMITFTSRKTAVLRLQERLSFQSYRSETTLTGFVNPSRYGQVV
jgi:hypothetical protein